MFKCYLDGMLMITFDFEGDAERWCDNNADLGEVWYEYVDGEFA